MIESTAATKAPASTMKKRETHRCAVGLRLTGGARPCGSEMPDRRICSFSGSPMTRAHPLGRPSTTTASVTLKQARSDTQHAVDQRFQRDFPEAAVCLPSQHEFLGLIGPDRLSGVNTAV